MKKKLLWKIPLCLLGILLAVSVVYMVTYYPADQEAHAAMESDEKVTVSKEDYGWLFDGPSEDDVLIFYGGAKVEEIAYAPLLHDLAEQGMDVCLLKLPIRFALFATDKADEVIKRYHYKEYYVGGHSLGGLVAGMYTNRTDAEISGLVLLASYLNEPVSDDMYVISVFGTQDRILQTIKVVTGRKDISGIYNEMIIEGGNHSQFGNYGKQANDGDPTISWEQQQQDAIDYILLCTEE